MMFSKICRSLAVTASAAALLVGGYAQAQETGSIRIAIAGDSTARDYTGMEGSYAVLHGWGQHLAEQFSADSVVVLNHGKGGCSSKSFLDEGRWDKLLADQPTIALIQFGHNDIPNKGNDRETKPEEMPAQLPANGLGSQDKDWFRHNIRTYITTARSEGIEPIIVTPMERRSFTSNGKRVREKNKPWADAAKAVAQEMDVKVIDMNAFSIDMLNELGFEGSLFMHPERDGEIDNTHFNEQGAKIYAEFIAQQLAEQVPALNGKLATDASQQSTDEPQ